MSRLVAGFPMEDDGDRVSPETRLKRGDLFAAALLLTSASQRQQCLESRCGKNNKGP